MGPAAVLNVYDASTKAAIQSVEDFVDGQCYVCTGTERLKEVDYNVIASDKHAANKRWRGGVAHKTDEETQSQQGDKPHPNGAGHRYSRFWNEKRYFG